MRTFIFFVIILLFSLPYVMSDCVTQTDNYAAEVVLNKPGIDYNLNSLNNAKGIIIKDNEYILQSVYNPSLAVILEKQSRLSCGKDSGLSVRLQSPVKLVERNLPYLGFILSTTGTLNVSENTGNGWKISCVQGNPIPQCNFVKGKTKIAISLASPNKCEIKIETNEELKNCFNCDGKCIFNQCITLQMKNDIEDLIKASVANPIKEPFSSYTLISSGNITQTEISPEINLDIDWEAAMKQELTRLRQENIIQITLSDIAEISKSASGGAAGQNNRILYCEDKNNNTQWVQYSETKSPILTTSENCNQFPLSLIPTGMLTYSGQEISVYYLIPIILAFALILLVIILIIVARVINTNRRKRRIKPITSIQSAG